MGGQISSTPLRIAWEALEREFRPRLVAGEFQLAGVQMRPERCVDRVVIPGVWAADMKFDFCNNSLRIGDLRYVAVQATRGPAPDLGLTAQSAVHRILPPITEESVRDLGDDEVLLLLEEHARRVIEGPDGRLIAPGKISLLPIIRGKMRHRANRGELLLTLSAEALWLANWIASKVTLHQTPTASTIAKVLSSEYGTLKARSNAAIQKSKG
jgi:hypothetical protein